MLSWPKYIINRYNYYNYLVISLSLFLCFEKGYGNYAFGYNEDHATGGTFRKEKGGPGVQVGSYGLRDADGRIRVVNYIADALGFRASVSTNEPGVDPKQDPAATSLSLGGESF